MTLLNFALLENVREFNIEPSFFSWPLESNDTTFLVHR